MAAIEIRYFSHTGNTKKLADAAAEELGITAQTVDKAVEKADILLLGASVYYGGIDKRVKNFIASLDESKVGAVALFSTSSLTERAYPEVKKLLANKNIKLLEDNFYCRGKFKFIYKDRPNSQDIQAMKEFARRVAKE